MSKIDYLNSAQAMAPVKRPAVDTSSPDKLKKAAQDFEAMFMDIVMKSMRDSVQKTDLFGDEGKSDVFQQMLDSEYSKSSMKQNGLGLADAIYKQLSQKPVATEAKNEN